MTELKRLNRRINEAMGYKALSDRNLWSIGFPDGRQTCLCDSESDAWDYAPNRAQRITDAFEALDWWLAQSPHYAYLCSGNGGKHRMDLQRESGGDWIRGTAQTRPLAIARAIVAALDKEVS